MKEIPLSQGQFALIDDDDFTFLNQWKWSYINGYPKRMFRNEKGERRLKSMHSLLIECPEGFVVDHINGDRLDNRKVNLRLATKRENALNHGPKNRMGKSTSKFKGVSWKSDMRKWRVRISDKGTEVLIGYYDTELAAAKAYNEAAKQYYGDFAWLNELDTGAAAASHFDF